MSHLPKLNTPSGPALETPEKLAVGATRPSDHAAVVEILRRAGLPVQGHDPGADMLLLVNPDQPGAMEDWIAWLAENPRGHLLLLVALPSTAIARHLAEGIRPAAAVSEWLGRAQAVLSVIRAQRRRVSLVFAEPIRTEPQAFLRSLSQRLSVSLQAVGVDSKKPQLPAALLRMMAENAILQSAQARLVAAELEANALPLHDAQANCLPAVDEVFAEYRNNIDAESRAAKELREENQLLLEQLQRVQQKMEAFSAEKQRAEQRAAEASQSSNYDRQLQDLREENELLLQQLHHVQEELEHYYLKSTQINSQEVEDLRHRLQAAEYTVQALYNSKSWKVTKPLRVMLDLLRGTRKSAD